MTLKLLWSYDDYVKFSQDKNPLVREWAAERLYYLYDIKAKDVLMKILNDPDADVAERASLFLEKIEEQEKELLIKPKIDLENSTPKDMLQYVCTNQKKIKGEKLVIETLAKLKDDRDEIVDYCINLLKTQPHSWGSVRAAEILGKIQAKESIPVLLEGLKEDKGDYLKGKCMWALGNIGEPVIDYLEDIFVKGDPSQITYSLGIIERLPYEKSVDILLKNFDKLWNDFNEDFLEAIRAIGSKRFIPPLKKELRPGEYLAEEYYYLLCKLNNVDDNILTELRVSIEKRRAEEKKMTEALLGRGNPLDLVSKTIRLELKCKNCGKTYGYEVEKVYIDTNTFENCTKDSIEPHIRDDIICKNCSAINNYEITDNAHLAIMAEMFTMMELSKNYKIDINSGPLKFGPSGIWGGKMMSPENAERYYQERIQKEPTNPELRVGYGNLLRNYKKHDLAIKEYLKAIELNPYAVEAYVGLAEIYAVRGDFARAYTYTKKCIEILPKGVFYRTDDKKELEYAVYHNLEYFREKAGIIDEHVTSPKVGRNDPCPCGSGKKYKKCCLLKEIPQPKQPEIPQKRKLPKVEMELLEKVVSYALNEIPRGELERALKIFSPKGEAVLKNKNDTIAFYDWYIHGYTVKESNKKIIDLYYIDNRASLTPEEQELVKARLNTRFGLFEVISVTPGRGFKLKDIFTNEEYDVIDVSGSHQVVKWDILPVRIYAVRGVYYLSGGTATAFRADEKENLKKFILEKYNQYIDKNKPITVEKFIQENSHIFNYYPRENYGLKAITEEGHKLVLCKTTFEITDFEEVIAKLSANDNFDFVEGKYDDKNRLIEAYFDWIKSGPSEKIEIKKISSAKERTLKISSAKISTLGDKQIEVLGFIKVTKNSLELECISKERLTFGEKRLKEILKHNIKTSITKILKNFFTRFIPAKKTTVTEQKSPYPFIAAYDRIYEKWLDTPIESFNGKTPREMAKTPEGKKEVEELLRIIENYEERKKKDNEPYYEVDKIRKLLGIS